MSNDADPVVGNWYVHLDKGHFRVVAIDELNETISIQSVEGEIEELDLDSWLSLELEPAEEPEDWGSPVDHFETDALDAQAEAAGEDWAEPRRQARGPRRHWDEDGEEDDWDEHEDELDRESWDEET